MSKITKEQWLRARINHDSDACLIWPFSTLPNGYGQFGVTRGGKKTFHYAHRFMCELVNGAPPLGHETAHACNNRACCNPRHLSWKTRSGNQLDRRANGTWNNAYWGQKGKLTQADRDMIVLLKPYATQRELAALFGCTFQNVSHIQRSRARAA